MSWSPEHKARSRQRILTTAARLFARQGFDQVSIDQVMQEAGMTRGAFYTHFSSKSELYGEAILEAAKTARETRLNSAHGTDLSIERLICAYLSEEHLGDENLHCPLAFLIGDITQRNDGVRDIWTRVFRGLVDILHRQSAQPASKQQGSEPHDAGYDRALQRAVMMIGGVAIARALKDEDLGRRLLDVCRDAALADTAEPA